MYQIISCHLIPHDISTKDKTEIKLETKRKHSKSIQNKLISYPPPQLHLKKYNRNTRTIIVIIMRGILLCKHHSIATTFKKRRENHVPSRFNPLPPHLTPRTSRSRRTQLTSRSSCDLSARRPAAACSRPISSRCCR